MNIPRPIASRIADGFFTMAPTVSPMPGLPVAPGAATGFVSFRRKTSASAQTMPMPPKSLNGMRQPSVPSSPIHPLAHVQPMMPR